VLAHADGFRLRERDQAVLPALDSGYRFHFHAAQHADRV